MGAINNAFNQAAGAVATAAYGIEKIKESQLAEGESAKKELSNVVETELPEMAKEKDELKDKLENNGKEQVALNEILNTPGAIKSAEDMDAYNELENDTFDDLKAANRSMQNLKLKISAKEDMRRRIEKAINRANNWRGR